MTPRQYIISLFLLAAVGAQALTLQKAKELYEIGEYAEAVTTLESAADKEPRNKALNNMAGTALLRLGNLDRAVKYLKRGNNESLLGLAEIAFLRYNFDDAREYVESYEAAQKKAKKPVSAEAESLMHRIYLGTSLLDRVERIEVIDSMNVDRETFFRYYKLSPSAGALLDASALPEGFTAAPYTTVYRSEGHDNLIWADVDADENYQLMGSSELVDGTWEKPHPLGSNLNEGGDANFPFLMADGLTLYYANDGDNSLGGYDIFITRLDGNQFLQPQNIGMPYNSPYDDYLLAIDEQTGVGWWATERNQLEDDITIYIFKPQEMRINYPVDEPHLAALARIVSIKDTWEPGADYSSLRDAIANVGVDKMASEADFHFALPGHRVYTKLEDFKSATARKYMREYLALEQAMAKNKRQLAEMRAAYAAGNTGNARQILALEDTIENQRIDLIRLSNQIVQAEPSR